MAALEWHARSDGNHWPLAERLRASLDGSTLFDARIARVDDRVVDQHAVGQQLLVVGVKGSAHLTRLDMR